MKRCKFCKKEIREEDIVRVMNKEPVCDVCARKLDQGKTLLLFC